MRILIITAFYPPFEIGGWGQLTRDLNVLLQARGHETHTLVSTHRADEPHEPIANVQRVLKPESSLHNYRPIKDFTTQKTRWNHNKKIIQQAVAEFKPDVVNIHGMWGLSKRIAWLLEQLCPNRVAYYLANDWPYMPDAHQRYWQDTGQRPILKQAKKVASLPILRQIENAEARHALKLESVMCVSQWALDSLAENVDAPRHNFRVVHNGINTELFAPREQGRSAIASFELLYAGSLVEHKGVHTAIKAMAQLKKQNVSSVRLTVMGRGHPDYEAHLKSYVAAHELEDTVLFKDWVAREDMPCAMQKHDALLLCTTTPEPLSRVMQEAMSAEMVVIGTLTGGTGELLVDGQTGLAFRPNDAEHLANCIQRLASDRDLRNTLAKAGRQAVCERFTMQRMVDEVEAVLEAMA